MHEKSNSLELCTIYAYKEKGPPSARKPQIYDSPNLVKHTKETAILGSESLILRPRNFRTVNYPRNKEIGEKGI